MAGLLAGCSSMDSLIFHPIHKLREQHEYNEAAKKAEKAPANEPAASGEKQ